MANIHLQGILVDSVGEIDVGGVITFTHLTTTGDTIASTQTELIIPPDGAYSIDVEYGQIRIDYTTRNTERFVANVIVNSASTATSLPELLSATTPVAKPIIIQMQGLVADATAAEAGAVAAAATTATRKDTFTNLIALSPTTDGSTFICQERASAEYILKPSGYSALAGDATFANGRVAALQVNNKSKITNFGLTEQGFIDALSRGSVVDLENKTLTFTTAAVTIAVLVNKKVINGTLNITASDTSFRAWFFLDNSEFNNVNINCTIPSGGQVALFRPTGNNSKVLNCTIDGKITDDGSSASHLMYVVQVDGSVNVDKFLLNKNTISNVSFVHLKTNATTTTQKGWKCNGNTFDGIYVEGVGVNSPNGLCEDFEIIGNTFLTHKGEALGTYALYVAIASNKDFVIQRNKFYGTVDQCIHVEENSFGFDISSNIFEADCKGGNIGFLENDVGGSIVQPKNGVVHSNVMKKTGTLKETGSIGIWIINNVRDPSDAKDILIHSNIIEGFEKGISLDSQYGDYSNCYNNTIKNCTNGAYVNRSVKQLGKNTYQDCDFALTNGTGYSVQAELKAIRCGALTSGKFTLVNPEIIFSVTDTLAGGTIYFPILAEAANTRVNGNFMITSVRDGSSNNTTNKLVNTTFDGSTLTASALYTIEIGSLQSNIVSNSSNIALSLFSSIAGQTEPFIKVNGFITIH